MKARSSTKYKDRYADSYSHDYYTYCETAPFCYSHDAVADIPPPKNTYLHENFDPSLGGRKLTRPSPLAIFTNFHKACKKTPSSDLYDRVIPWDHSNKDFCYGAIHDHIFRGYCDRRTVKRRIDQAKSEGDWDPVSGCACCLIYGVFTIYAVLIATLFLWCFFRTDLPWKRYWIFWVFAPLLLIFFIITVACIIRGAANNASKNRRRNVNKACKDINARYLKGTGVSITPGPEAAYLIVSMPGNLTNVLGDELEDRRLLPGGDFIDNRNMYNTGHIIQEKERVIVKPNTGPAPMPDEEVIERIDRPQILVGPPPVIYDSPPIAPSPQVFASPPRFEPIQGTLPQSPTMMGGSQKKASFVDRLKQSQLSKSGGIRGTNNRQNIDSNQFAYGQGQHMQSYWGDQDGRQANENRAHDPEF